MKVKTVIKRYGLAAHTDSKVIREWVKTALQETALLWHRGLLPKHFRRGATAEYGYRRRSPKTLASKRAKGIAPIPLVTKKSPLKKLSTRTATVSGTSKRVRVSFHVPVGIGKQYLEEITRVSARDQKAIANVFDRAMQRQIDVDKTTKREMIG